MTLNYGDRLLLHFWPLEYVTDSAKPFIIAIFDENGMLSWGVLWITFLIRPYVCILTSHDLCEALVIQVLYK